MCVQWDFILHTVTFFTLQYFRIYYASAEGKMCVDESRITNQAQRQL
jgi:hypothetical protein